MSFNFYQLLVACRMVTLLDSKRVLSAPQDTKRPLMTPMPLFQLLLAALSQAMLSGYGGCRTSPHTHARCEVLGLPDLTPASTFASP